MDHYHSEKAFKGLSHLQETFHDSTSLQPPPFNSTTPSSSTINQQQGGAYTNEQNKVCCDEDIEDQLVVVKSTRCMTKSKPKLVTNSTITRHTKPPDNANPSCNHDQDDTTLVVRRVVPKVSGSSSKTYQSLPFISPSSPPPINPDLFGVQDQNYNTTAEWHVVGSDNKDVIAVSTSPSIVTINKKTKRSKKAPAIINDGPIITHSLAEIGSHDLTPGYSDGIDDWPSAEVIAIDNINDKENQQSHDDVQSTTQSSSTSSQRTHPLYSTQFQSPLDLLVLQYGEEIQSNQPSLSRQQSLLIQPLHYSHLFSLPSPLIANILSYLSFKDQFQFAIMSRYTYYHFYPLGGGGSSEMSIVNNNNHNHNQNNDIHVTSRQSHPQQQSSHLDPTTPPNVHYMSESDRLLFSPQYLPYDYSSPTGQFLSNDDDHSQTNLTQRNDKHRSITNHLLSYNTVLFSLLGEVNLHNNYKNSKSLSALSWANIASLHQYNKLTNVSYGQQRSGSVVIEVPSKRDGDIDLEHSDNQQLKLISLQLSLYQYPFIRSLTTSPHHLEVIQTTDNVQISDSIDQHDSLYDLVLLNFALIALLSSYDQLVSINTRQEIFDSSLLPTLSSFPQFKSLHLKGTTLPPLLFIHSDSDKKPSSNHFRLFSHVDNLIISFPISFNDSTHCQIEMEKKVNNLIENLVQSLVVPTVSTTVSTLTTLPQAIEMSPPHIMVITADVMIHSILFNNRLNHVAFNHLTELKQFFSLVNPCYQDNTFKDQAKKINTTSITMNGVILSHLKGGSRQENVMSFVDFLSLLSYFNPYTVTSITISNLTILTSGNKGVLADCSIDIDFVDPGDEIRDDVNPRHLPDIGDVGDLIIKFLVQFPLLCSLTIDLAGPSTPVLTTIGSSQDGFAFDPTISHFVQSIHLESFITTLSQQNSSLFRLERLNLQGIVFSSVPHFDNNNETNQFYDHDDNSFLLIALRHLFPHLNEFNHDKVQ